MAGSDHSCLKLYELRLCDPGGAKYGDTREWTANHRNLIAGVEPRARLAILVDLVRKRCPIYNPETEMEEEVRNAGEETDRADALFFRLVQESLQQLSTGPEPLRLRLNNDGSHLCQVRSVQVQRAATEKVSFTSFSDSEVTYVLADLRITAPQQRSVMGEGIDEVEDVDGVPEVCLPYMDLGPRTLLAALCDRVGSV